jgi:pimeloyl-ACP methyl ester carboxylesterase
LRDLVADVHPGGTVPVVLLHGQPGTAGDWQWVVPLLAGRYHLVVPDRPGYGRTGGRATGFAGNAAAVIALLDRLGLERAVLAGHSWAGGVVIAAAGAHPDRVAGLVLVSSVGPGEHLGWSDRLLAAPMLGEAVAATTIGGVGLLLGRRRVQAWAERRLAGRRRESVRALARLTGGGGGVWRSFVVEQRALISELDRLRPTLAKVAAPTAVVHGRGDHVVPPGVAEDLAAAIPRAGLRLLNGAGHLLPRDRPSAIADAVDWVGSQTAR